MKKVFLSALIVLALVIPVQAQSAKSDSPRPFEAGWNPVSYLRQEGKNLRGGTLSLAMRRSDHVSYVLDVSIHQTRTANPFTTTAYRFGLRYYATARGKFTPFGEVLGGGANLGTVTTTVGTTTTTTSGHNGVSLAAGGGVDMAVRPWFSWRVLQVDYSLIHAGGSTLNGVRAHSGAVFHFGHSK